MIAFRDASQTDADTVAAIGRDTFVATFGPFYTPQDLAAFVEEQHSARAAAAYLARSGTEFRLVEDADGVAGYAMLAPDALPFADPAHPALEIKRFYLLARLHGTGAADRLMDWCVARAVARGHRQLSLSVFSANARAMRFYTRHGFVEVGRYVFMVGSQADDERVWRRSL